MPDQATVTRSFRDSLHRLRSAQKSPKGAPLYSLVVNRPLGRVFAAGAFQLGLRPNHVTVVSAAFTFTGIALIALRPSTWITGVLVAVALVIGYALDAADGQLARLTGTGSSAGEWLDHVIDSMKIATLHLAVLIAFYRFFDLPTWALLIPLVFSAAYVVHFFGMLLTELLARVHHARNQTTPGSPTASTVMSVLKLPTDYGLLCVSFLLLGWHPVFVVWYTLLAVAMVGYTILVLPAWYRRTRRLGSVA